MKGAYEWERRSGHPLANSKGEVQVHRRVLWDALEGEGVTSPQSRKCHWCGWSILWTRPRRKLASGSLAQEADPAWGVFTNDTSDPAYWSVLIADHVDGDTLNQSPGNLVASCTWCNSQRAQFDPKEHAHLPPWQRPMAHGELRSAPAVEEPEPEPAAEAELAFPSAPLEDRVEVVAEAIADAMERSAPARRRAPVVVEAEVVEAGLSRRERAYGALLSAHWTLTRSLSRSVMVVTLSLLAGLGVWFGAPALFGSPGWCWLGLPAAALVGLWLWGPPSPPSADDLGLGPLVAWSDFVDVDELTPGAKGGRRPGAPLPGERVSERDLPSSDEFVALADRDEEF